MTPLREPVVPSPQRDSSYGRVPEAAELGHRLLSRIAEALDADAALFLLAGTDGAQLTTLGIESSAARAMAVELRAVLERSSLESRALRGIEVGRRCADWSATLVTRIETQAAVHDPHGLLALFSRREGAFEPHRDGRIATLLGGNAAIAVAQSLRQARLLRRAERRDVQVEELERVRGALETHSREVERSLAVRSRFFAAMSHELRTPINAIVGYNDLLHQGILGTLNERQVSATEKIARCAEQLLALVDDALDFAQIDAGRLRIRRDSVELSSLLDEAASSIELDAIAKGLDLEVIIEDALPALQSDADRVRQILLNLLSNAVKFTPRGSVTLRARHFPDTDRIRATLRPQGTPGTDGWIGISVHDTGIGISDEQIAHVFDEFVRTPRAPHTVPGTGLGLAISHHLARLLGGELRVESELGVRSTFMLLLPCPTVQRGQRSAASLSRPKAPEGSIVQNTLGEDQ